ncbi:hypothetical protein CGZ98_03390 [Enemella evansiae]|uniref:DUF262 domain-containing protein n=1 Tax=Enemella evansiae TaxID=2016499 RepID=UPI000B96929F|nr:DUF262 domain-containing protein [Enemella evansiae]OYO15463.1 hypothetical protein CGZ98_03390 [Enemella evansiae]
MAEVLEAEAVLVLERFSAEVELACPLFQRRYVWDDRNLKQLFEDLRSVVDGVYTKRFLGALVFDVESTHKTTKAGLWWIIDGQQRLTTLYLILVAASELAAQYGDEGRGFACDTFADYLVSKKKDTKGQPRLRPTLVDTRQFHAILHTAAQAVGFTGLNVSPAMVAGEPSGRLTKAYKTITTLIREWIPPTTPDADHTHTNTTGLDVLNSLRTPVLEQLEFVEITLGEEHDPNEVFDRLNKEGERLGIIDLLRNYVLRHLGTDPQAAQLAYNNEWIPFEKSFATEEDKIQYFFPFALTIDASITKAKTFRGLATYLEQQTHNLHDTAKVDAMVKLLRHHVPSYSAIASRRTQHLSEPVKTAVERLVDLGAPSSIYPYVMQLLTHHATTPDSDANQIAACLAVIESFLVRRAICGIEPTGLHAVFKKLWPAAGANPEHVRASIVSKTVVFPDDVQFTHHILTGELYHRRICKYILVEYEKHYTAGDVLDTFPPVTIDHLCPQSLDGTWADAFTTDDDRALIHTWANLVPLSSPANSSKGAKSWTEAKDKLSNESVFATTKHVYDDYPDWTPRSVRARAEILNEWAQQRWPQHQTPN